MSEKINSDNIKNYDLNLTNEDSNYEESNYEDLISRLKEIKSTIASLEKTLFK